MSVFRASSNALYSLSVGMWSPKESSLSLCYNSINLWVRFSIISTN